MNVTIILICVYTNSGCYRYFCPQGRTIRQQCRPLHPLNIATGTNTTFLRASNIYSIRIPYILPNWHRYPYQYIISYCLRFRVDPLSHVTAIHFVSQKNQLPDTKTRIDCYSFTINTWYIFALVSRCHIGTLYVHHCRTSDTGRPGSVQLIREQIRLPYI